MVSVKLNDFGEISEAAVSRQRFCANGCGTEIPLIPASDNLCRACFWKAQLALVPNDRTLCHEHEKGGGYCYAEVSQLRKSQCCSMHNGLRVLANLNKQMGRVAPTLGLAERLNRLKGLVEAKEWRSLETEAVELINSWQKIYLNERLETIAQERLNPVTRVLYGEILELIETGWFQTAEEQLQLLQTELEKPNLATVFPTAPRQDKQKSRQLKHSRREAKAQRTASMLARIRL